MILSCLSNHLLEEVREAAPNAILWLNLYLWKGLTTNEKMIRRAEAAGFAAIVISIDIGVLSTRRGLPIGAKLDAFPVAHFTREEVRRPVREQGADGRARRRRTGRDVDIVRQGRQHDASAGDRQGRAHGALGTAGPRAGCRRHPRLQPRRTSARRRARQCT